MYTCYTQSFKSLASFCSWAGWFESYLVENPRRHIFAWCGSMYWWLFTAQHILNSILTNFDEPWPGPCFSSACGVRTFENGISALNLTECIRRKTQLVTLRNDSFFFGMLWRFLSSKFGFWNKSGDLLWLHFKYNISTVLMMSILVKSILV